MKGGKGERECERVREGRGRRLDKRRFRRKRKGEEGKNGRG